jgi:hypothetical protein
MESGPLPGGPGTAVNILQRVVDGCPRVVQPRGPAIDGICANAYSNFWWWPLSDLPAAPPGGPLSTSPTPMVATAGPASSTPRGPAIDVAISDGGRCRAYRRHPPESPPSTSPIPVVATAGPNGSTPQGARHRRRQLRWWPLSDLSAAPLGGPLSTSPTLMVAAARPVGSTP